MFIVRYNILYNTVWSLLCDTHHIYLSLHRMHAMRVYLQGYRSQRITPVLFGAATVFGTFFV